jgi:hypothetical protein
MFSGASSNAGFYANASRFVDDVHTLVVAPDPVRCLVLDAAQPLARDENLVCRSGVIDKVIQRGRCER